MGLVDRVFTAPRSALLSRISRFNERVDSQFPDENFKKRHDSEHKPSHI